MVLLPLRRWFRMGSKLAATTAIAGLLPTASQSLGGRLGRAEDSQLGSALCHSAECRLQQRIDLDDFIRRITAFHLGAH